MGKEQGKGEEDLISSLSEKKREEESISPLPLE